MSDGTFIALWLGALAAIAVLPVFGWFEALQGVAAGLWFWVMIERKQRP